MNTEIEVENFTRALNELLDDPLLVRSDPNAEEAYGIAKSTYVQFRKLLTDKMEDLRDFRRMTDESDDIEKESRKLEDDVALFESTLHEQQEKENELQIEANELRELTESIRRWSEDASRISEKRIRIGQKNLDLSASVVDSSRDLRTVERDMNIRMEEKDNLTNKINRLNKEMTQLNNTITQFSISVSFLCAHLLSWPAIIYSQSLIFYRPQTLIRLQETKKQNLQVR
jgi:chromosome segregation ATPase